MEFGWVCSRRGLETRMGRFQRWGQVPCIGLWARRQCRWFKVGKFMCFDVIMFSVNGQISRYFHVRDARSSRFLRLLERSILMFLQVLGSRKFGAFHARISSIERYDPKLESSVHSFTGPQAPDDQLFIIPFAKSAATGQHAPVRARVNIRRPAIRSFPTGQHEICILADGRSGSRISRRRSTRHERYQP